MTIFAAIRGLTFLARDVFEAALYLIPAPGLSGYDVDSADLLAERVGSDFPMSSLIPPVEERAKHWRQPQGDCCLGGDFPPAADDAPTPPDHPSYPQTNGLNQTEPALTDDELVALRQLIEERFPSPECDAPFKDNEDLGPACTRPGGHEGNHFNPYLGNWPTHAPVASASPPTPADATGQPLVNDPKAPDLTYKQVGEAAYAIRQYGLGEMPPTPFAAQYWRDLAKTFDAAADAIK